MNLGEFITAASNLARIQLIRGRETSISGLFLTGLTAVILLVGQSTFGATYYVATNGSDSNRGNQSSPFQTIQKAADVVTAGDTVLVRGGSYAERIQISRSGNAGAPITFKPEPGTGVVFLKHPTNNSQLSEGIFDIYNQSYIRIEGFHFKDSQADQAINVVESNGDVDFLSTPTRVVGIEILGNTFQKIGNTGADTLHTVILVARGQEILIANNTFVDCYGTMVTVRQAYRITVRDNEMRGIYGAPKTWSTDLIGAGIWFAGSPGWEPGSNLRMGGYHVFENNLIHSPRDADKITGIRCDSGGHSSLLLRNEISGMSSGVFLESRCHNNRVEQNIALLNDTGFDTPSPAIKVAKYNSWLNNVAYKNNRHGFAVRQTENSVYRNNIAFDNGITQFMTTEQARNNEFDYNLLYSPTNSRVALWDCPLNFYNGSWRDSTCFKRTDADKTFAQWKSLSGGSNSISADPLFADLNRFFLSVSSPAKGAGENGTDMGLYPDPPTPPTRLRLVVD